MIYRDAYQAWRKARLDRCRHDEAVRLIRVQFAVYPGLEEEVLIAGAASLMRKWAASIPESPVAARSRTERQKQKQEARAQLYRRFETEDRVQSEKAKNFDRIVEMLDHKMVGAKLLGDCTRADLLRAAVADEQKAGELTLTAGFYRLLAGMIGRGTVREASDRGKIVALLTHTFKSES